MRIFKELQKDAAEVKRVAISADKALVGEKQQ